MPKETGLWVALSSFWSPFGLTRKGDIVGPDDARFKKYPMKFKPYELVGAVSAPVEQATSAPGEKRAR